MTVGDNSCTGVGPNKKLAKRSAAEQMLQLLGLSLLAPQPAKSAIKSTNGAFSAAGPQTALEEATNVNTSVGNERKMVKFVDGDSADGILSC